MTSLNFYKMQELIMPYVFWINKAVTIVKTYCKSLGLKHSQLNLYDVLEEHQSFTSPYAAMNDHDALVLLTEQIKTPQMRFLASQDEGLYLVQILEKT